MRIAVLLHMFNTELVPEFKSYLNNLNKAGVRYDLFVAAPAGFSALHFPSATLITHEDRGFDIASFFTMLYRLPRGKYTHLLKLHSKSNVSWRKALMDPLLGSPQAVAECLRLLHEKGVGLVGAKRWLLRMGKHWGHYHGQALELAKVFRYELEPCQFIGGTMFWARVDVYTKALVGVDVPALVSMFHTTNDLDWRWYLHHYRAVLDEKIKTEAQVCNHWKVIGKEAGWACNVLDGRARGIPITIDGMLEHAAERMLGLMVTKAGYECRGV